MPIRLMYQNVNNFGYDRFFTDSPKKPRDGGIGGLRFCDAAQARRNVLTNTIVNANPDLISIVEVNRGQNGILPGNLVFDLSAARLLHRINALGLASPAGARTYKLVPPIVTGAGGRAEGVAVFYDTTVLQFLGPWAWPGGQGPANTAAAIVGGGGVVTAYPPNWTNAANPANDCLPNRVIGPGLHNAGLNENTLAAQWHYVNGGGVVEFPAAGYRRAILTLFTEINPPNRILKLVSLHAPPDQVNPPPLLQPASVQGTANLANITEITGAIAANEVYVICGDFNVSLFLTPAPPPPAPATLAYGPILAANFTQAISRGVAPALIPDAYPSKSYLITHNRPSIDANPWVTNGYPGFGYLSEPDHFGRYDAIDNIFTRYGAGLVPPPPNTTILNTVSGSPFAAAPAPPGPPPVPQGFVVVPTQLNNPASLGSPAGRVVNAPGALKAFSGWNNYRKIRSTSDHFALAIDL